MKSQNKKPKRLTKKGLPDRTKTGAQLVAYRWAKTGPEERAAWAGKLVRVYWDAVAAEEAARSCAREGKKPGSSARLPEQLRCPCGIMSLDRAKEELHMPEAKEVAAGRMTNALD
jgi:hypothetical protein